MSQSDSAQLSQNKPAGGVDGVPAIVNFYNNGNEEMKLLLSNECDIIFECRYCRSLFRSIINFTAHKRQFCKGTFGAVTANARVLWDRCMEQMSKGLTVNDEAEDGKPKRSLMNTLNRRATDISVPIPGYPDPLILHTYPRIGKELAATDKTLIGVAGNDGEDGIPDDRVAVVFPTDPNFRHKSMKMRSRRDGILAASETQLSPHEMACLHRILKYCPDVINESARLKCHHPDCAEFKAFTSYAAFSFHIGIKHASRVEANDQKIPCYLCNHNIKTWTSYYRHYQHVHKSIREEHDNDRVVELGLEGKRREYQRGRSLSPAVSGVELDEKESSTGAEEQRSEESSPPVIQPIDAESSNEDDQDEESMPVLPRMGRKRFRGVRPSSQANDDQFKPLSRCSSASSVSLELSSEPSAVGGGKTIEEILENKFHKDVKDTVELLVSKTEDLMGDKPVSARITLLKALSASVPSRSVTPTSQKRRVGKKTFKLGNPDDEEEDSDPEKDDEKSPSDDVKEEGARASRTRKRPIWMASESYLFQDSEKEKTTKKQRSSDESSSTRDDSLLSVSPAKAPITARQKAKYEALVKQQKRSASDERPAVSTSLGGKVKITRGERKSLAGQTASSSKKDAVKDSGSDKSLSPDTTTSDTTTTSTPVKSPPFVLPADPGPSSSTSAAPPQSPLKPEDHILTPRAKKLVTGASDSLPSSPGASRRKQDMSVARDTNDEGLRMISNNGKLERYADLATVPVYLSQAQRDLFFSGLKAKDPVNANNPDKYHGGYFCEYCKEVMPTLKEGRRHMVAHIRVMRLRCKLCQAGAFFCTDMRSHLQERHCPELKKAPAACIRAGVPCMSRSDADSLTEIVDPSSPGRVVFTSGQIVSTLSKAPYFPDPVIEEKILGPSRVPGRTSASNTPVKPSSRVSAVRRL